MTIALKIDYTEWVNSTEAILVAIAPRDRPTTSPMDIRASSILLTNLITGQKSTFVLIAFGSSSLGLVADSVISVMTPFAGAFQPEALSFVVKQVQVIDKNQCGGRKKPK